MQFANKKKNIRTHVNVNYTFPLALILKIYIFPRKINLHGSYFHLGQIFTLIINNFPTLLSEYFYAPENIFPK